MPSEKISILLNPSAGRGKALRKKDRLLNLLKKHEIPFDLFISQNEEDLRRLAGEHAGRYRVLVGAGGDSTFHIIVNEILKVGAGAAFGIIGLGSSNDIAREFGAGSMEDACAAIKRGRTRKIDLGGIIQDGKQLCCYIGQANIGLGAWVNRYVVELSQERPLLARFQTAAGILGIMDSYRSGKLPLPLTVESERGREEGEFTLAVFSNIRYWATGKCLCPDALPDDGLLDGCLIEKMSFLRLARISSLAVKGKHSSAREVRLFQAPEFEISSPRAFEIQTDGEIIGGPRKPAKFHRVRFKALPKALAVVN